MDQNQVNEAIKDCVRYTMSAEKPLEALQNWCDRRAAEGWPKAELAIVRKTALRMLSAIYDIGDGEPSGE
jgi:hypothetical protein